MRTQRPGTPGFFSVLLLLAGAAVVLVFGLSTLFSQSKSAGNYKYRYVGVSQCVDCHGPSSTLGDQVSAWKKDAHAQAYQRLTKPTPRLLNIKERHKITNPEKDRRCLKCHTTGGHRSDNFIAEGVGCEACHGPAEKYKSFGAHAGFNGYKNALKLGMNHILGDKNIRNRRYLCQKCHKVSRRLCADPNPKIAEKDELSLQQIVNVFVHKLKK